MKTILVTGGAGFIGSHTVVELAQAGYRPVIIDNFSNSALSVIKNLKKILDQDVPYYNQNFQDINKLQDVIDKEAPIGIIHFAAYKAVGESVKNPLKYYENNVSGLIQLLKFCEVLGSIKHFVFSSSCTVYGDPDKLPVTEEAPIKPAVSPYGATKQMGETILRDNTLISHTLNSISLRYFNPIGAHPSGLIGELPKGTPANLVPFITQTAAGLRDKLIVYGKDYPTPDGSCVRDYIHVVDLAKAHVKALTYLEKKPTNFYDVVNLGVGEGISVLEVIKSFETSSGVKLQYEIGARRSGDIISTYASVKRANQELDWYAEKTLSEALTDAWNWQQKLLP